MATPVFCQEKTGDRINSNFTYCEIAGTSKLMGKNITIKIDFGQSKKFLSDKRYQDPSTGKPFVFNSIIDALNFMGKEGWKFVQEYTEGDSQTGYIYHFLLEKKTSNLEEENSNQK
jgi:hypothetical protein